MDTAVISHISELVKWVENNPLIVTVTSSGAIIWLFTNLKTIWRKIVGFIESLISFKIYNTYEDTRNGNDCYTSLRFRQELFNKLITHTKTLWERTVNLDLNNGNSIGNSNDYDALMRSIDGTKSTSTSTSTSSSSSASSSTFTSTASDIREKTVTATYGFSIKLLLGKLCFINRSYRQDGMKIIVDTTVQVFFARKKAFMKKLEDYIRREQLKIYEQTVNGEHLCVYSTDSSFSYSRKFKRSLESIFTDGDVHIDLYNDIKKFLDNKDVYRKLNYPYNYCALLYGVPGSGKTSTILALASMLHYNIRYVNLATITPIRLMSALNESINHEICVFEDIDAISTQSTSSRETVEGDDEDYDDCSKPIDPMSNRISLSDLLNITDGLLASDNTICIFTTNHIEKLDPALIRAGRMNKLIEYKYMNASTAARMVKTYLDVDIDGLKDGIKPPELQEMVLDIMIGKKTIDDLKSTFCSSQQP